MIGTVARLQLQRSRLKPRGTHRYDPSPLLEVSALDVGPRGVQGDGHLDVHHADHPDSRNRHLRNGLSLMTVSRYRALRDTYGPHLVDGIAGESLLLDTEHLDDLSGPLLLDDLDVVSEPAPPCVEFSRFVLGRPAGDVSPEVLATMKSLDDGARGYYLQVTGTAVLRAGSQLRRR